MSLKTLTYQERCLVFWGQVSQKQHLYQILKNTEMVMMCSESDVHYFESTWNSTLTLQPSNLGGRTVALLIAGGDAEDDGRLGGVVNVSVGQAGRLHQARRVGSTIHAHEG